MDDWMDAIDTELDLARSRLNYWIDSKVALCKLYEIRLRTLMALSRMGIYHARRR